MSAHRTIRREDERFVAGRGRYVGDLVLPNQAYGAFLRSPHAHAEIARLDTGAARAAPGVLAVLTGADIEAAGIGSVTRALRFPGRDGKPLLTPHWPALAQGGVRHVGQTVALVVAESAAAAQDAAELIAVEWRELPPLDPAQNVAVDWAAGNEAETEAAFARAARVVRTEVANQRLVVASMEPRGAIAAWDAESGRWTLHVGSQGVFLMRNQLAGIMNVAEDRIRVLTPDVGGAFGMKTAAYPEYPALLLAAKLTGRPVKWVNTRSESFVSDSVGRDMATRGELALDADGRFLALRIDGEADIGAFATSHGAFIATFNFSRCLPGVYRIPAAYARVRCLFSNSTPNAPYRGAGRPEANYLIERLVEQAARETGIDRIALRRRNLLASADLPWKTPFGMTYDSGDFPRALERALAAADHAGFSARREASARAGRLRGFGIGCFLEIAGGLPSETASLAASGEGVTLRTGSQSTGQAHETVFAQLLARRLGIPAVRVAAVQGDSDALGGGTGSVASRSIMVAGAALGLAADRMLEKGHALAAQALEAAPQDIEYGEGRFRIKGTDRSIGLFDLAARHPRQLDTEETADIPTSFPNGCHVAEVEIDRATGVLSVVNYVAVDDSGTIYDETIVHGQSQGGIAQGLGQVLLEAMVHDASGQPLTGSFMDYAMPRADDMPPIRAELLEVPCRSNPLGAKGAGESGTTGGLAALANAVLNALGADRIELPATPERIWRAIHASTSSA